MKMCLLPKAYISLNINRLIYKINQLLTRNNHIEEVNTILINPLHLFQDIAKNVTKQFIFINYLVVGITFIKRDSQQLF